MLTGGAVGGLLASAGSGRLVLATTDWADSFALVEFLIDRPGGRSILSRRLRVVLQQRRPRTSAAAIGRGRRRAEAGVVFETLFVTDAFREALGRGAPIGELRAMAQADGFTPLATRVQRLVTDHHLSAAEAARLLC